MIYLKMGLAILCLLLVVDLFLLIHRWFPQFPSWALWGLLLLFVLPCITFNTIFPIFYLHLMFCLLITQLICLIFHQDVKGWVFFIPFLLAITICIYGIFNMKNIEKTTYDLQTSKNIPDTKIVMISDLHYPNAMTEKDLNNIVKDLQKEKPSFYILNGDIVDEFTSVDQMKTVFQTLGKLTKTADVYYVFGNHDNQHYANEPAFSKETLKKVIESNGITVLQDDILHFDQITLIGREDSEEKRESLKSLVKTCNLDSYIIVFDHQPKDISLCEKLGVDLQLSGHTHSGQIFPVGSLANSLGIFEHGYGMIKKGNFTQITTSGIHGWGFPTRTEGISEYVSISITSN